MLKITIEENPKSAVIKLEGRIAGPWTEELDRLWESKSKALAGKTLSLDLRETTFVDAGGMRVLRAIYSQTRAVILSGTPWTKYLADEVAGENLQHEDAEV